MPGKQHTSSADPSLKKPVSPVKTQGDATLYRAETLATAGNMAAGLIHEFSQPLSYLTTDGDRLQQIADAWPAVQVWFEHIATQVSVPPPVAELLQALGQELDPIADDLNAGCASMRAQLHRLRALTDHRSNMTHLETWPAHAHAKPLAQIRAAIEASHGRLLRAGATATVLGEDAQPPIPDVAMPAWALFRIVYHLLQNGLRAVEHRPDASKSISVQATFDLSKDSVVLVVVDEGQGMDEATCSRACEPLFSLWPEGAGLGLAHVQRLVDMACGSLKLISAPNKGTRVEICLPCASATSDLNPS